MSEGEGGGEGGGEGKKQVNIISKEVPELEAETKEKIKTRKYHFKVDDSTMP